MSNQQHETVDVAAELEAAFLEYSLSVLVSRAIPDAADGLKPVQRRLLYAMWRAGIRPEKPHRKSIAAVSETLKSYHPHGDQACYQALVRMAQPFSLNIPLVDGHGNMGSLDNAAAAARYTEARLSPAAVQLLAEVDEDTVNMRPNFDASVLEPIVLPAAWPSLLVEGASGIAVGTTTAIPPHNLTEVVEAVKLRLLKPKTTLADILAVLHGPDFPSGGEIVDTTGLADIYKTGTGTFTLRAKVTVEHDGKTDTIVVTELPYQVGPEKVVEKVRALITAGKLDEVTSIEDFSDRHNGMQLRIAVTAGASTETTLAKLFKLTPLEENQSVNMVALVNGRPKQSHLLELLDTYRDHRLDVIRKRSAHRQSKAERRLVVVNALIAALDHLDAVIEIAKTTPNIDAAEKKVAKLLGVDIEGARAVLDLPIRRFGSLERKRLLDEHKNLTATVKQLDALLKNDRKLREAAAAELDDVVAQLGTGRKTRLGARQLGSIVSSAKATGAIALSTDGLLHPADSSKPPRAMAQIDGPGYVVYDDATAVKIEPAQVAGGPIDAAMLHRAKPVGLVDAKSSSVMVVHVDGTAKRVDSELLAKPTRGDLSLSGSDLPVVAAFDVDESEDVAIVSSAGMVLRFPASQIRPQGAKASGMAAMKADGDVVAAGVVHVGGMVAIASATADTTQLLADVPSRNRAGGGVRVKGWPKTEQVDVAWVGPAPKLLKRPLVYVQR